MDGIGGNGLGNFIRCVRHAAFGKKCPQLFHGAQHALLRRAFRQSHRRADFGHAFVLKIAQHQRVAVAGAQAGHGLVEQRGQFRPEGVGRGFFELGLHEHLLFAADAAHFRALKIGRHQPRGVIKPAGQNGFAAQRRRLARQNDEHSLRDVLRVLRIGRVPQRDGVNEADVPSTSAAKAASEWSRANCSSKSASDASFINVICAPDRKGDKEFFRPAESGADCFAFATIRFSVCRAELSRQTGEGKRKKRKQNENSSSRAVFLQQHGGVSFR